MTSYQDEHAPKFMTGTPCTAAIEVLSGGGND